MCSAASDALRGTAQRVSRSTTDAILEVTVPITLDGRIKFGSTITLPDQTGSLTVDIFGGPLARVQAAVFDANDKPIQAVGFDGFGPPLTTEIGGRASWLFQADPRASYVK